MGSHVFRPRGEAVLYFAGDPDSKVVPQVVGSEGSLKQIVSGINQKEVQLSM